MKVNELSPGLISSGAMYQLRTTKPVEIGDVVRIDGPWDTFGYVIALNEETGHHSIRGVGKSKELSNALLTSDVPYCIGE